MAKTPKKKNVVPSEIGVTNVSIFDYDYCMFDEKKDLKFPYSVQTYKHMRDSCIAIASALNAVQIIALRVPRYIEPYNQTALHKSRADFVDQNLGVTNDNNDMTHSFDDFLREALSMNTFGFSIHEKVFRYRLEKDGSKYDDGKIGVKRLPIRPQHTIEEFKYDDKGRELTGVVQKQAQRRFSYLNSIGLKDGAVTIPRERFMLFNADKDNGNAEGLSPLHHVYDTWREYQKYKDLENIASSKNLNGLPVLWMPAEYMTDDEEDETSEVYKVLKDGISKISVGQQTSLILPSDREDVSNAGGKLFDFSLMSASSSNITAITAIIQRLTNEIYQCLFADVLQMGNERGGNSNLASAKSSMLNMLVENRIKEIFTVINNDLIPDWFERNGWDKTKTPKLKYGTLKEVDVSTFAKAIQQTKATKTFAVTVKNINYIAEVLGLPERLPEDLTQDELDKILGVEDKLQSKSGTGMASDTGGLNGQGNSVSEDDNSATNKNNK